MMDMANPQYSPAPEALLNDLLVKTAWANVVLHVLGLGAAVVWMRPGTAAFPVAERMAYLSSTPAGWRAGWALWALCALALLAFFGALAAQRKAASTPAAFALACSGAAIDLTCDTLFVTVLPRAAAGPPETFLLLERGLHSASLAVANGLYSVAVLVASRGLRLVEPAEKRQRVLALLTFVAGSALAAAGLLGEARLVEIATGPTIAFFMAWTLVVAAGARQRPA